MKAGLRPFRLTELHWLNGTDRCQLFLLGLFLLGWLHNGFTLYDVGTRSITLLHVASMLFIPFCFTRWLYVFTPVLASTMIAAATAFTIAGEQRYGSHFLQQCLGVAVAAGAASLDWPRLIQHVRRLLAVTSVPVIAYAAYQVIARPAGLPYAFLRLSNQQQYAISGLQRGFDKPHFSRASSVFVEPSDLGYYSLWLLCFGLTARSALIRYVLLAEATLGILFSQSLGAAVGAILLIGTHLWPRGNKGAMIGAAVLLAALAGLSVYWLPGASEQFGHRLALAAQLNVKADSLRITRIPSNVSVFLGAPMLGHGLARSAECEPNGIAIGYLFILIERGVLGTLLFLCPYIWGLWCHVRRVRQLDDLGQAGLLVAVMNAYALSTFAMIYFQPFWLALGFAAWSAHRATAFRRRVVPRLIAQTPNAAAGYRWMLS